jgi:GH15 family glucan-1,4-alpha-glucosidase
MELKARPETKAQETEVKQPQTQPAQTQEQPVNPDPKAQQWAQSNTWFGQDEAMTYTAFSLHKKLVEEEGYDPQSDEYYSEIDKRIKLEFPHKFGSVNTNSTSKPTQVVASANRSSKPGRKTVRLTPSQVAIANKLGVPLEDYAKQLKLITKE